MFTINKDNIRTVTDMRTNTIGLLKQVKKHGYKYIFRGSVPEAVLVDIKQYHKWMDELEDQRDAEYAKKLENVPNGKGMSLEEFAKANDIQI